MNQYKRKYIVILLSSLLLFTIASASKIESKTQAIGKAGMQRMLVLSMLKDFTMLGMGVTYTNAQSNLNNAIETYEKYQETLYNYTDDNNIKESIEESRKLWLPIKDILTQKPEKKHIEMLRKNKSIIYLRKAANKTVMLLVKKFGIKTGEKVNLAGKIRAVSQKIAGVYMLRAWGMNSPILDKKMSDAMKTLESTFKVLNSDKENTQAEKKQLKRLKKLLLFFKIKSKSKANFTPSLVSKYSDELLVIATKLTKLYVSVKK